MPAAFMTAAAFWWLPEPRSSPAPHFDGQRSFSAGGSQVGWPCASTLALTATAPARPRAMVDLLMGVFLLPTGFGFSLQARAWTGQASRVSICPASSLRSGLQRLALGDARDVEALEAAVALVELHAHPYEQIVEGVAAVAQGQALDGFQLAPPLAREAGEVVLEEHDGGREDHAPALGQRPLLQHRAVEVGDLARAPQVELHDGEILAQVVVDVFLRQHLGVQLDAVGAAALLEDDGKALARRLGLREVVLEVEEGKLEPALVIEAVGLQCRLDARRYGADRRRQRAGLRCICAGQAGQHEGQGQERTPPVRR